VDTPFRHAGSRLLTWASATRTFRRMHGEAGGSTGLDDAFASNWSAGIGAEIMGRNKFGPYRAEWGDEDWRAWWGDDPVFHTPVIVLTHHPRPRLEMQGGTSFEFLDASAVDALGRARELAGDLDVRIGGGPSTVRALLTADLIDRMHIVVVPIVFGRGVRLWDGLDGIERRALRCRGDGLAQWRHSPRVHAPSAQVTPEQPFAVPPSS
jgi:dihydrofolate reductase